MKGKLKLFYFGPITQRPLSLEKALMLGNWKEREEEAEQQEFVLTWLQWWWMHLVEDLKNQIFMEKSFG